jgi:hypothetical protein
LIQEKVPQEAQNCEGTEESENMIQENYCTLQHPADFSSIESNYVTRAQGNRTENAGNELQIREGLGQDQREGC